MPLAFQIPMVNNVETAAGQEIGICMSISAFWIQRCRLLGQPPGPGDQFFMNWREYETMAVAFETLLSDYTAITGGDAAINSQARLQHHGTVWHDQFGAQLGVPIIEINWGTADTLPFLISLMEGGPQRGYFLSGYEALHLGGGGLQLQEGHTVALWYGLYGKTFLDPNYGTATVARHALWMPDLMAHLMTQYGNFNQWVLFTV